MFIKGQRSLLDLVLEDERKTFKANILDIYNNDINTSTFHQGNVVYKVPYKRASITTLLSDNVSTCVLPLENWEGNLYGDTLLKEVSSTFLNLAADADFATCMQIIHSYQHRAGNNFYGALLRDTTDSSVMINPFHILTALSVLESPEHQNRKYNILMYFYPNREHLDTTFRTDLADHGKIDTNINALMQSYTSKSELVTKVDEILEQDSDNFTIISKTAKHPDDSPDHMHFIVTHQVLTKGIMCPYYGSSLIQWNNEKTECVGAPLSPFLSCNISSRSSTYPNNSDNLSMHSVCTGSESNLTLDGLRTLTHAYLGSAYIEQIIRPGALAYADAMIHKSTQLYLKAGVIKPIIVRDPMKDFTDDEKACTTLKDFVKLRQHTKSTEPIDLVALTAQYRAMQELLPIADTLPIAEPELPLAYTHLDGSTVQKGDRFVYTNAKSGRRVVGVFVPTNSIDSITIRQASDRRLLTHKLVNVRQADSTIVDNQRVFVGDTVSFSHRHAGLVNDFLVASIDRESTGIYLVTPAALNHRDVEYLSNLIIKDSHE